jgi:hypothetical protein
MACRHVGQPVSVEPAKAAPNGCCSVADDAVPCRLERLQQQASRALGPPVLHQPAALLRTTLLSSV